MRIAVLSDIHGNLAALEAVLGDAAPHAPDVIVNLGDILSGPLQPAETADRLIALDLPTIRGNHERQLLEQQPADMGESDAFTHPRLTDRHREWLTGLPTSLWITREVHACHGTPASDLEYFLETVTPVGARAATPDEVIARATNPAPVILCGHTHLPRAVTLPTGQLIVNPGSVGLPAYAESQPHPHVIETGTPHARYALVERTAAGWHARLLAVAYDHEAAAALAEARNRPDWARALRTGRA